MDMKKDRDIAIKFDSITRKLRESGIDLSEIKISTNEGARRNSYITRRIMEEMRKESHEDRSD